MCERDFLSWQGAEDAAAEAYRKVRRTRLRRGNAARAKKTLVHHPG
jgi:hypothetical protein